MNNINNYIAVTDDGEDVLGKILYYSLSSLLIDRTELEQICETLHVPCTGGNRPALADAFRNATGDIFETRTVQGVHGAERFKVYCRDNVCERGVVSRELVKETLDAHTNTYKKLANLTFAQDAGFSYGDLVYDEHVEPLDYCREAETLFELYQTCAGRKQVETLLEAFVESLQSVKLLAHGKMYFVPREHMHQLDVFEELIRLIEDCNRHKNKHRLPIDVNSMYVVNDVKQREKMAAAFYRSVRRDISEYQERANHLIQTGSQSAAVMERWVLKIDSLRAKKREYEGVLRRELTETDDDFNALEYLAQELQLRASGIRRRNAA